MRRPLRRHLAAAAPGMLALLAAGGAHAQWQASATLVSEHLVRGQSLSDGRPALQASVNYDAQDGWYAGAFASQAALRFTAIDAQLLAYAGYAQRIGASLAWEAGASQTAFVHGGAYNYGELYVGLGAERANARLYLAPSYFGRGRRTLYADINGSHPLTGALSLTGHLGYLHPLTDTESRFYPTLRRWDSRIGLALARDAWRAQLAWVATRSEPVPYAGYWTPAPRPHQTVLSVSRGF